MTFITALAGGIDLPVLQYDDGNARIAALGATSVQIVLPVTTTLVTLTASGNCWIRIGAANSSPVAVAGTAGNDYLAAGQKVTRVVPANGVIAVVRDASATGWLAVMPAFDLGATVIASAPPTSLTIDNLLTAPLAAYSFRKLRAGYAGKAMQVKRASDSAVQDIGFTTAGDFDVAAFTTFIGASTGSVNIWYDQSGSGLDLVVPGGSTAPAVSRTGMNGHPALVFTLSTDELNHQTTPVVAQPLTLNAVAERTGNFAAINGIVGQDGGAFGLYFAGSANQVQVFAGSLTGNATATDSVGHSLFAVLNGASSTTVVDGLSLIPTYNPGSNGMTGLRLANSGGFNLVGNISEVMVWSAALSADTVTLSNDQLAYWFGTSSGLTATAATQLTTSIDASVSSLDTGRIGTFTAWGGSEYGYNYTYALSGAVPAGVSIDPDMGYLTLGSPLAAGTYPLMITARNRDNPTLARTFNYALNIAQGVTSGRTGAQILHKTYAPDSGTWGNPVSGDWTAVLLAMQSAILADQAAAGEGLLHATIVFKRGSLYSYTVNTWPNGIQYCTVIDDGQPGALPQLRCNKPTYVFDTELCPINTGQGNAFWYTGTLGNKVSCGKIATVAAGSSTVTLLSAADASKFKPGRWHAVLGHQDQIGGFPPNCLWCDFVKVVSVSGTTVTLDRPLKFRYDQTWWEETDTNVDASFGVGWLVPWDMGRPGGLQPGDPGACIRGLWKNIQFVPNPNTAPSGTQNICQFAVYIDFSAENCVIPQTSPTMSKHMYFFNCSIALDSEPDKLSDTLMFDNCQTLGLGGATGFNYMLCRNSTHQGILEVSPRQLRVLNTTVDATGHNDFPPFQIAYPGACMYYDFESCIFKKAAFMTDWTYCGSSAGSNPANGSVPTILLGTDANFVAAGPLKNQLQIPFTFVNFRDWIAYGYEGMIINTTSVPVNTSWGYVDSLSSDGAGNFLYMNVVWVAGTQPGAGAHIWPGGRYRRITVNNCTLGPGTTTQSPLGFMKETPGSFSPGWDFPIGYPAKFRG